MDELTITLSSDDFETVMLALDVTAARYEESSKTAPHLVERTANMRAVYNRLRLYQSVR